MNWIRRISGRGRIYDDLSAEIAEHLDEKTEELVAAGLSPEEASRQARREFGNVMLLEQRSREVWQWPSLESFVADIRFALRMLRRSPGFTAIAALTIALGIGASTAVFSLVNTVLLKPLPFPRAEQIVFPWRAVPAGLNLGYTQGPLGRAEFLFLARESKTFEHLGAFESASFNLTLRQEPVHLDGLQASAGFFPALGVSPVIGRTFTEAEDYPGREHEVILSDSLWRGMFGADPNILGRTLELDGAAYTVIGVMPRGFAFPRANEMPSSFTFAPRVQLWVPLALNRGPLLPAEPDELAVIGRVKDGVSVSQAAGEMQALGKHYAEQNGFPPRFFRYDMTPIARQVTGDARRPLLLILGAVGVLLLIACSNVSSLLVARALGRKREFSLRSALGAGKLRLLRQLLTESLLLAGAGGVLGILLAEGGVYFFRLFGPPGIPRLSETNVDPRVLSFTLGVTLLTGILFGLAPAIGAAREDLAEAINAGGERSGAAHAGRRTRNSLLVSQIALALVLVIAAGLLTRTFYRLLAVDTGFRAARVLTFQLSLPAAKYPDQQHIVSFYQDALRKLQSLPGVDSAGITETIPMDGATENTAIRIPGQTQRDPRAIPAANYTIVSPGYFAAAGTPIVRGRPFLESDTAASGPVTIISDAMARQFWPGQDPLGKQVAPRSRLYPAATIVGIAADVKRLSLREDPPAEMYVPYTQKVWPSLLTMSVLLRTRQDPAAMATSARQAIYSIDGDMPIANVRTLERIVADSVVQPRFAMLLLAGFGGLALLLASVGMYGVICYSVAQRAREIGVRMALGAQRRDIFGMVLGQGGRIALLGVAIGLAASFVLTRLMNRFLFGVSPTDLLTFAAVSCLLFLVALLACYIPARRATRVDPMDALRYE